jgi:hypothetical protein
MKYVIVWVLIMTGMFAATAGAGSDEQFDKKGIGVSCKRDGDCASGYCKPNKAHLPGYVGTCQRK